ncbi:ATP-dependent 6-phosphofructokinase [Eubacterium sp. MSJ-33]|uniref:ATP-dependent 6-phosphofructokinase n=1 Tax=Eubacterium sp. MSJ-33 TaxID=2841528 RepID=UPI001C7607E4|nr:ATP-dependent 6-phosphofructokinase [Eubacterium sp. MSJ-33]QWT52678.1 6-phosphofructokinase [Eubacterium sp. MSJ-33]
MSGIKKIAVLTSGGDAPGMNSAVRAVVFSANNLGIEVVGVLRGYEGLIDWETVPLGLDDVRNINNQGGTILFTSRSERFLEQKYRQTAAENLRAHDVDAVVAIGGDGTLRGAIKFRDEGVNIVCIPGTIDRDVACSEYTLGFDTAANTAMEAIDKIRDSSVSHGRCSVVEVMGRKRGYIALWAGMATSADAIVLPEKWDGNFDYIINALRKRHTDGRNSYLVVVAEGVTDAGKLADLIQKETGIESRVSVLGYIQRGGQPTAKDRMYGSLMGAYAIEILRQGRGNRIVAIKNDILVDYDIAEAIDLQNNNLDSFQYQLSLMLAE